MVLTSDFRTLKGETYEQHKEVVSACLYLGTAHGSGPATLVGHQPGGRHADPDWEAPASAPASVSATSAESTLKKQWLVASG